MFRAFRILDEARALEILSLLQGSEWDQGKARTEKATETVKRNQEIVPRGQGHPLWPIVMEIRNAVASNGDLMQYALMQKMTAPKFNRYTGGGTYHRHYDASPMGQADMRTDWSCTVFLTPPDQYQGGELVVEHASGARAVADKGAPGTCVVYDCGEAHWVNPVTEGARISSVIWMRSLIRDPKERSIVSQFAEILKRAEREEKPIEPYGEDFTTLTGIQTMLCRKWMDA